MLTVDKVHKSFGKDAILKDCHLSLAKGQMLSVLGRSGSGKTTLLKILAGLETLDQGDIQWEGTSIVHIPPTQRQVVYLYQEALLFPHLDVFENIAFGLRLRKYDNANVHAKVNQLVAQLELGEHRHKMPHQLSGGQKQRVAFGRAIIIEPMLLLLDEPFGALDVETRTSMQTLLKDMAKSSNLTGIFVTHDLKEALIMGDQWGLMQSGQLQLYANKAAFIKDPATGAKQELAFWNEI